MAEDSKWNKTLDLLKQANADAQGDAPQQTAAEPVRIRPRSKRSDPAWKPYTLMLKTETHKEASLILKRMDTGQDLSDLAQELFEQWVKTHR